MADLKFHITQEEYNAINLKSLEELYARLHLARKEPGILKMIEDRANDISLLGGFSASLIIGSFDSVSLGAASYIMKELITAYALGVCDERQRSV